MAKRPKRDEPAILYEQPRYPDDLDELVPATKPKPVKRSKHPDQPITIDVHVRLQAIAIREQDGQYSIAVPGLTGCYSSAETLEEARANASDAARLWLESQFDTHKDAVIEGMRQ